MNPIVIKASRWCSSLEKHDLALYSVFLPKLFSHAAFPPFLRCCLVWKQTSQAAFSPFSCLKCGDRKNNFLLKSPWRVPFGKLKQNAFSLLVEPPEIQAKLHVGQSEITVNYLCASRPVTCSSQYSRVRPEHAFKLL